MVLGAAACDDGSIAASSVWPAVINLVRAPVIDAKIEQTLESLKKRDAALRATGRRLKITATAKGTFHLGSEFNWKSDPGGNAGSAHSTIGAFTMVVDDLKDIVVEELAPARDLPIISICDLLKNLSYYNGKRVAVRGEEGHTSEGEWLTGSCPSEIVTDGYHWSNSVSIGTPAYYAGPDLAPVFGIDEAALRKTLGAIPKALLGRQSVTKYATFVGQIHARDKYVTRCDGSGKLIANGFGHLNGSIAELLYESVRDPEVVAEERSDGEGEPVSFQRCTPPRATLEACSTLSSIVEVAQKGCTARVRELLKNGADVNVLGQDGSTALRNAAMNGYADIVEIVLEAGADPNISTKGPIGTPLCAAAQMAHDEIVKLLLAGKAEVNPHGQDACVPLQEASQFGNLSTVQILLAHGAEVDRRGWLNETPLQSAVSWDRISNIRALLAAGADVDAKNKYGETSLAEHGYFFRGTAKVLLEAGADVNARDDRGNTPLMHASRYGYEDVVRLLLDFGADVNLKANDGSTALIHAAIGGYVDAIPLLLAKGANVNAKDNSGKTALDYAREGKHPYLIKALRAR